MWQSSTDEAHGISTLFRTGFENLPARPEPGRFLSTELIWSTIEIVIDRSSSRMQASLVRHLHSLPPPSHPASQGASYASPHCFVCHLDFVVDRVCTDARRNTGASSDIHGTPQLHRRADGALPMAGITMDAAGNLYGTTSYGGAGGTDLGTVFRLKHSGPNWILTTLHTFVGGADGAYPYGRVAIARDGRTNTRTMSVAAPRIRSLRGAF